MTIQRVAVFGAGQCQVFKEPPIGTFECGSPGLGSGGTVMRVCP
jgi:hypothetical protein